MIDKAVRAILRLVDYVIYSDEAYARAVGVKIGHNCLIDTRKWGSEPFLIEIGDHVYVTAGVNFVTHDGGIWVFDLETPSFDVFGRIKIGNNTYIGNNVTILPGVTIGNNCIIGAESVVTKSIPDDTVAAGNPIRFICNTNEYKEKMLPLNVNTRTMAPAEKKEALLHLPPDKEIRKRPLR